MSEGLIILGATSKIAQEVGRVAARHGREVLLVARSMERAEAIAGDLRVRGASKVTVIAADLGEVLLAYGSLGDQERADHDIDYTLRELNTNFTSAVSLLSHAAEQFEGRKKGVLAVITSVAGDRARRSNYVYGTAKGALTLFAQGLRARLFTSGVRVLTIKPGPVDTPMTAHMKKGLLMATPQAVAAAIYREMEDGTADVIYVPGYWWLIMAIIKAIPEGVAKKLKF